MTAGWCPRCEACGAFSCNGIDCYLADEAIPEDEVCLTETLRPPPLTPEDRASYEAWLRDVDRYGPMGVPKKQRAA